MRSGSRSVTSGSLFSGTPEICTTGRAGSTTPGICPVRSPRSPQCEPRRPSCTTTPVCCAGRSNTGGQRSDRSRHPDPPRLRHRRAELGFRPRRPRRTGHRPRGSRCHKSAGFEGYTRYDGPPIDSRSLGFSAAELRLTRFGVAAAHAAEQAAGMELPEAGSSAGAWLTAWFQELQESDDCESQGRALLRVAARGMALSHCSSIRRRPWIGSALTTGLGSLPRWPMRAGSTIGLGVEAGRRGARDQGASRRASFSL